MQQQIGYALLGFVGMTLIVIAGYTEWISLDLQQRSLQEYLFIQVGIWLWWAVTGIPFIAGVLYVCAAVAGPSIERRIGTRLPMFIVCFLIAVGLMLSIGGIGYYAAIATALVLVVVFLSERKRSD